MAACRGEAAIASDCNMRYQDLFILSAPLGNAFAQTTLLSLQNNRVEQADCAPKVG
jgi:hypothetical protein